MITYDEFLSKMRRIKTLVDSIDPINIHPCVFVGKTPTEANLYLMGRYVKHLVDAASQTFDAQNDDFTQAIFILATIANRNSISFELDIDNEEMYEYPDTIHFLWHNAIVCYSRMTYGQFLGMATYLPNTASNVHKPGYLGEWCNNQINNSSYFCTDCIREWYNNQTNHICYFCITHCIDIESILSTITTNHS